MSDPMLTEVVQYGERHVVEPLRCPECGHDRIEYVETIECSRYVAGIHSDGHQLTVLIHGYYRTEGWDEGGRDFRWHCTECMHEWPVTGEVDFI